MKKSLLGLSLATMLLVACGNDESKVEDTVAKEQQGIEVDKGLTNVELTLPAAFFEGSTPEEIEASAKEKGIKEVKINEDGSVYYKMSRSAHKEMLVNAEAGVVETIDELINSEDFTSFKEISYNKNFTEFDVKVDRQAYENSFDGFGILGLAFGSMLYNAIEGADTSELKITMAMIDATTDEQFDTVVWPDDLENVEGN
ncbi:MAG: hypothetical protein ABS949_11880 [Solibacillus sp.]